MTADLIKNFQIPEQGQLVETRSRRWLATEIKRSQLKSLKNLLGSGGSEEYHLVTLASVEDDSLQEEIQIVWELDPGADAPANGKGILYKLVLSKVDYFYIENVER